MTRVEPPELGRLLHECVPRMIIAVGLPRTLARAVAERDCTASAMRERLSFVHDEARGLARVQMAAGKRLEAERADLLAVIASLLAMRYEVRGHDSAADALLQQATELCVRWTMSEVAGRPKSSRLQDGWASLRARLSWGRRKSATVS